MRLAKIVIYFISGNQPSNEPINISDDSLSVNDYIHSQGPEVASCQSKNPGNPIRKLYNKLFTDTS